MKSRHRVVVVIEYIGQIDGRAARKPQVAVKILQVFLYPQKETDERAAGIGITLADRHRGGSGGAYQCVVKKTADTDWLAIGADQLVVAGKSNSVGAIIADVSY